MELLNANALHNLSENDKKARNISLVIYGMFGAGVPIFFFMIIGVAVSYFSRAKFIGTIAESHCKWQIRTFWWSLLLLFLGIATAFFGIGYLLIFLSAILICIRTVWGAIRLYHCLPM